jgi:hypothetical protein
MDNSPCQSKHVHQHCCCRAATTGPSLNHSVREFRDKQSIANY